MAKKTVAVRRMAVSDKAPSQGGANEWSGAAAADSNPSVTELLRAAMTEVEERQLALLPGGLLKVDIVVTDANGRSLSLRMEGHPNAGVPKATDQIDHWRFLSIDGFTEAGGKAIEDLGLAKNTLAGATSLKAEFPDDIVFSSGRRSVSDQCRAMAQNIVSTGDRKWIQKTYIAGGELQIWVDKHPDADTVAELQAGLESVMAGWDDAKKATISRHLSGAAFDIVPVSGAVGTKIKKAIGALPKLHKFLDGENGVNVWHAQFDE